MTETDKTEKEIAEKQSSLDLLKIKLIELTAEFRKNQEELNRQIFTQNQEEFADIDLTKLLTTGEAFHTHELGPVKVVFKTLTKKESTDIDKRAKTYFQESKECYLSNVQTDTLSYVIVEYNGNKSPIGKDEKSFGLAKESVNSLSSEVIDRLWSIYTKMTRFIRAALEINLKN